MIENGLIIVLLLVIVAGAVAYLIRAKRRGQTCVGCPYAKQCGGGCHGACDGQDGQEEAP